MNLCCRTLSFAGFAGALLASSPASALDCDTLPNPVYGLGANAVKPLFKRLGQALSNAATPETIVYQAPGQCVGINALASSPPTPLTGTALYWDGDGVEQNCDLPVAGTAVEFAAMNSSATLCPGISELPPGLGDFTGPVQSFDFIVPKASSETTISAAAAYFVFGFGAQGQAEPWVDEAQIFIRDQNSGPALFTALAIGVPVNKLKGVDAMSNANTVTLVAGAPDPDRAIGIVAGEVAAANRDVISSLAYQHYGQSCGYWPDSTPTSTDKRNIRDGHYYIWSPIHFFAAVDGGGVPVLPGVERLVGYFTGAVEPPDNVDMLAIEIASGTVPECAMQVRRDGDLGEVESYAPENPCGCYFDDAATGSTSCQACQGDDECPASATHCRFGFCEVY